LKELWNAILNLKAAVTAFDSAISTCWVNSVSGVVHINDSPSDYQNFILILCDKDRPLDIAKTTAFVLSEMGNVAPLNQKGISVAEILFLKKYLPYCFLSLKAKRLKRAISTTHFAQTLDAKIATNTGDSKWIGNDENLIHAHRMRALCDGVLVGRRTVEADEPKLNVRHVCGQDPVRIVLGNPNSDFNSLLNCSDAKILYIEGGATTTSIFIKSKAVDVIQLHIAPMIFGSGKSSIELPNIDMVKEAISFSEYHFLPFGDSVMFTGFLN